MTQRILRPLAATLILAIALLAGAATAAAQSEETIIIGDTLRPAHLEVEAGTVVTWRNDDGERHRVRSREGPVEFDSGNLEPGEVYVFTFSVEGVYDYRDERNDEDPAYAGTVVVREAGGTPGPLLTSASVIMIDEAFQPPAIEVAAGATVEWLHQDGDDQHTVTSSEGLFDSGVMDGGATFSQTFESSGTFAYFCAFHAEMQGTVTVSGPAGEPGDPVTEEATTEPAEVIPPPADDLPRTEVDVALFDREFLPPAIEISAGATVTWTNDDREAHTVTALDGAFDSGVMAAGATFSHTFDTPGLFDYFCAIHPEMRGSVTALSGRLPADSG